MKASAAYRYPSKTSVLILGSAALFLFLVFGAWKWFHKDGVPSVATTAERFSGHTINDSPAAEPRVTFATPYRNVRQEVKYVGDDACSVCHQRISKTYHRHPMGRSLSPAATTLALERYDATAHNPFETAGFRYAIDRRGERVFHKETAVDVSGKTLAETEAEVQFAIGSGARGRSYVVNRDGYLFASPISWYPQKGIWDLSPGYTKLNPHFGRPIGPDCLFCHANQVEHVEYTANRYRPPLLREAAIGCERCHGPGELHVRRHENNEEITGPDDSIVNPRHLEHGLREGVCQQCHLQGEQRVLRRGQKYFDYRPGLPLELFFADFVRSEGHQGDTKFVGTVEQMYASRCFRESKGPDKMGCISCHDPHKQPAVEKKTAFYRARCLSCHEEQSCSLPRAMRLKENKEDNCIACHMPRTGSDVSHTSITDHRIPRRPQTRVSEPAAGIWPQEGQIPLDDFRRDPAASNDPDGARDLGVALMDLAERQPDRTARQLSVMALPLLQTALARDPTDLPAWQAAGSALWHQSRLDEANRAFENALKLAPDQETTLFLTATLAMRLQRNDAARNCAERAIRVNPWRWQYHQMLAAVLAHSQEWDIAIRECQDALKLNPASLATRSLLITCYVRLGKKTEAREEFGILAELSLPQQRETLRRWFDQQMR